VGKILDDLRAAGVLDDTVVAITSDHGTEFFEHGEKTHRLTVFDEVIRIPLIIRYPASLPAGTRVLEQTRTIDVGPTLLELAGAAPMPGVMGHSLVGLMHGQPLDFDNTAVSELLWAQRQMRSIRTPAWKFVDLWQVGETVLNPHKRLYVDLIHDPGEQHPQWDLSQGLGAELLARYEKTVAWLDQWHEEVAAPAGQSAIPEQVLQKLGSIGYVGGVLPSTTAPASQPSSAPAAQPPP
jgi:arylsulfatase A-like enzyme